MLNNPRAGFDWTAEYMVSSLPWVTSSTASGIKHHEFPKVTKEFVIKNQGAGNIIIAFTRNGLNSSNYIQLVATEAFSASIRVKDLWISGSGASYTLFAGLTLVDRRDMPVLTGSLSPSDGESTWEGIG